MQVSWSDVRLLTRSCWNTRRRNVSLTRTRRRAVDHCARGALCRRSAVNRAARPPPVTLPLPAPHRPRSTNRSTAAPAPPPPPSARPCASRDAEMDMGRVDPWVGLVVSDLMDWDWVGLGRGGPNFVKNDARSEDLASVFGNRTVNNNNFTLFYL